MLSELFVQELKLSPRVIGCTDRPQDIVLMGKWGPNTPRTASPMNFATVPPWRSMIALIWSK